MKHLKNLFGAAMLLVAAMTFTGCGNIDNPLEEIGNSSSSEPTPSFDAKGTPLTFEAVSGSVTLTISNTNTTAKTLEYKVDEGEWTSKEVEANTTFDLPEGKVIQFRGEEATYGKYSGFKSVSIFGNADYYIYGNIMSLVGKDNFSTNTTLTGEATFLGLFSKYEGGAIVANNNAKNHPSKALVLPATTLTKYCYYGLFTDCKSITQTMELPATTLEECCYASMFSGTGITSIPEDLLPAGKNGVGALASECYHGMFISCANLTSIPSGLLPATTLVEKCYYAMFAKTGLTSIPANLLPATTMKNECYYRMFQESKLKSIPAGFLPATTLAEMCYEHMFSHCPDLKDAPSSLLPAPSLAERCYYCMFYDCPELTSAPDLKAGTLVDYCYNGMFQDCKKLNSVTCLATSGFDTNNALYFWIEKAGSDPSVTSWHLYVDSSVKTSKWDTSGAAIVPTTPNWKGGIAEYAP